MFHSAIQHVTVVPYTFWHNTETGRNASIFGALPWIGEQPKEWIEKTEGYTYQVEHKDGSFTYGLGRRPAKTENEAIALAMSINAKIAGPIGASPMNGARP
jgi:hypothetical protein